VQVRVIEICHYARVRNHVSRRASTFSLRCGGLAERRNDPKDSC
jgi:hypothetical protein